MAIVSPTPYWGNAHPCSMYRNGVKLVGYKELALSGTDMAFEDTYNDRVDVVAQGRSWQEQTVQGKNLLDYTKVQRVASYAVPSIIFNGINLDGTWYVQIPVSQVVIGSTYVMSWVLHVISGNVVAQWRFAYSDGTYSQQKYSGGSLVADKATNFVLLYVSSTAPSSADYTEIQLELGTTATPYEPFIPNSPSPDYPSPIISANGDLVVEGPPGRPIITHALPELRAIPDGAGGWVARDEIYVERVGGEWHLMRRQRIRHREFTGVESGWYMSTWSGYSNARAYGISAVMSDAAYTARRIQYMCSHFVANALSAETGSLLAPGLFFINNTKNVVFGMDTATFTTLAQWLSFLAVNPITVDYVLAIPIIIDLGPIDLPSYYPYTRVCIVGDYPPDVTARVRVIDR